MRARATRRTVMLAVWAAALLVGSPTALYGCGGSASEGGGQAQHATTAPPAVELALQAADGRPVYLGDLRGEVVVVFLFATFDGVSQAALRPLARVGQANPDVQIVGIAVQPNPAPLIDAYVHALSPPFLITFEPDETVLRGESAFGPVEAVPSIVVLDARGRIQARSTGFPTERHLQEWIDAARRAAPPTPRTPPPLLGN